MVFDSLSVKILQRSFFAALQNNYIEQEKFEMNITKSTVEEFAKVLLRIGEAGFLGSIATFFVKDFSHPFSVIGLVLSIISIFMGLYVNNLKEK